MLPKDLTPNLVKSVLMRVITVWFKSASVRRSASACSLIDENPAVQELIRDAVSRK